MSTSITAKTATLISSLLIPFSAAAQSSVIECHDTEGNIRGLMVYESTAETASVHLTPPVNISYYGQDFQGLQPGDWEKVKGYLVSSKNGLPLFVIDLHTGSAASEVEIEIQDNKEDVIDHFTCPIPRP